MAEPPRDADDGDQPDREPIAGTPRWAKVFGIVTLVVIMLLVVLLVTGGHGPGRHGAPAVEPPADARAAAPSA